MQTLHTLVALVGLTTCAVGCASTRSSAGSFVTDVRIEGDQLKVDRCRLGLQVTNRDALRLLLFPLMAIDRDGGGLFTRRTPEATRCSSYETKMLETKGGAS
jgi:hypothetical protein